MRILISDNAFREAVLFICHTDISNLFVGRISFFSYAFFHPDGLFAGTFL